MAIAAPPRAPKGSGEKGQTHRRSAGRAAASTARKVATRVAWRWVRRFLLAKASVVIAIIAIVIIAIITAWLVLSNALQGAASSAATSTNVPGAVAGINPTVLDAIKKAIGRSGELAPGCTIRWTLLAGIGEIESHNAGGRTVEANGDVSPPILGPVLDGSGVGGNLTPQTDRAQGPYQFMPATWASAGQDGNGDGKKDPQNIYDAAAAALVYLCGRGKVDLTNDAQMRAAILRYNHSSKYVEDVVAAVKRFEAQGENAAAPPGNGGPAVESAIAFALKQLGLPYVWGGDGPPQSQGFDCSGLTKRAYGQAGINLPRTSREQFTVNPRVAGPGDGLDQLRRGDLLFWAYNTSSPGTIHHVALYLGDGQMVEAADFGIPVRQRAVYFNGFIGATRPAG